MAEMASLESIDDGPPILAPENRKPYVAQELEESTTPTAAETGVVVREEAALPLVNGHRYREHGVVFVLEFPHLCPGDGCAIAEWGHIKALLTLGASRPGVVPLNG